MSNEPQIARVRHELRRRQLTVTRVEALAPQMIRVVLGGEDLQGFTSLGFDDHVKLFFPATDSEAAGESAATAMRDFTPRYFDADKGELWIDFFVHEAGPAATWAAQAAAGQSLQIGGPKGSVLISDDGIDAHVLIGDETALPAISRRLEELPAAARTLVVVEVDELAGWPALTSPAEVEPIWVARKAPNGTPASDLIDRLRQLQFPAGQCFVWVAMESQAARAIRRYLIEERGLSKKWIKAAGYWRRGAIGAHDKIADEE